MGRMTMPHGASGASNRSPPRRVNRKKSKLSGAIFGKYEYFERQKSIDQAAEF
jgi:hypothetical protein